MTYSLNWNLDTIYPGGIHSPEFAEKLNLLAQQITNLETAISDYNLVNDTSFKTLSQLIADNQTIFSGLRTATLFVNALSAADYTNSEYRPYQTKVAKLSVAYQTPLNAFAKLLTTFSDDDFNQALAVPAIAPVAFHLKGLRHQAARLLDDKTEQLLNTLKLDGLDAWSEHYDTISAGLTMTYTDENSVQQTLSAGQALNRIDDYPDNTIRAEIMRQYEKMWGNAENLAADTLNHLAGARLTEQSSHGYDDFLAEPLELNHLSRQTLNTMWQVVDDNKAMFKDYFERKAQLLGLDKIGWQDQSAPITKLGDYTPTTTTYDDAAAFIIKNFGKYSPKMAAFAQNAFENQWIEAENRPGKTPGAWMESVPDIHESRIITTFTGSVNDSATIAHEIGHGFHTSVLTDLPVWRDDYAMNVAETASTFAEMLIADANVQAAKSDAEKVVLLDAKMANPIAMFLNIRARFLFENNFYTERQAGFVPATRLNELMSAAQEQAFGGILDELHPHFWASKLHFYINDVPFYNFPYTFGYLFSQGIYAWAQTQENFEEAYIALLRDTANMTTEELAQKHLGVDLTKPDFWQAGADLIKKDIDEFLTLSEQFI
ncbi:M3 family oligoendopeptidase [Weissella hellenica]|uniref:M3 family oligoendopeptidase n=1 Tax=Weissella hellenica TaxID=46256 RepID=A0A4Y4G736_WEIHE|nr:M3 family oligoendopeptidase [Weissella hellenica]NKY66252.1 M3 family oligoendopeptidase [Weissella hellenica]GED35711.1 oligoendopeptidase F [Weissella hellenica]SCB76615.1 oligoendopeptidase, pepF/M3 family [Weissella hellenica]